MLTVLRARELAILDRVELQLGPGLSVVTGETGAGKSILVDALALVLGGRGRADLVRTGAEAAEVEALFDVTGAPEVRARLEAAGLDAEGGELLVRRVVQAGGRTRAYVNGRLATAAQLAEITAGLVDLSSQHEHHALAHPRSHLALLDAACGLDERRADVVRARDALLAAAANRDALDAAERGRAEREDYLRFSLRELAEAAPVPREDEDLRRERDVLRHAETLALASATAEDTLYSADGAVAEALAAVGAKLAEAARLDPRLAPHVDALAAARAQVEDVACELGRYARSVAADPERLAAVEDRLERIDRLARKHGGSLDRVLERADEMKAELAALERHDELRAACSLALAEASTVAATAARSLSAARREGAARIGVAIARELAELGMVGARVAFEIAPLPARGDALDVGDAHLGQDGIDRIELLFAPNPGEAARPLSRIASGGELSRTLLAVKRVLATRGNAALHVFDEVDAGTGGAVAEVLGRKLRDVARESQVLCITHLPQIAVYADAHYRVTKGQNEDRTVARVEKLGSVDRREEVARMLGGLRVTAKTRGLAAEMLAGARSAA